MHEEYKKFFKRKYGNSSEIYKGMVRKFLDRLPPPNELDADYIMDFIGPYAAHTQKMLMGHFRNLFKYLKRYEEIEDIRPKRLKGVVTAEDLYTGEEIKKIIY